MFTKDGILKIIIESGSKGTTRSEIYKKKTKEKEIVNTIVQSLVDEGKVIEKGKRLFAKEKLQELPVKGSTTKEEFAKLKDFIEFKTIVEKKLQEIDELRGLLYQLKNEIDRAYDYINDVFIYLKEPSHKKVGNIDVESLRMIYDNLNAIHNFGDSVPIPIFKDEVKKQFDISDEEIDKILLDLDNKEIIYLQTLDNPKDFSDSNRGIKFEGRILYFITWMKREY
ncbi:hypothetical protein [Caldisericum exile]|uniref:Uncharacterized protein n=1 Tax=Caldisericum exile (strain DSM 21853 / NBRC 104410 / AZM16c01) TaxID=511051 RepID=A0A7U6GE69_CALEA|nr:hypothetical protein [Caldisericum exile]BAL80745.1 hypothetical protein CSE_06190 [Caldisericum exile AZM16c01]